MNVDVDLLKQYDDESFYIEMSILFRNSNNPFNKVSPCIKIGNTQFRSKLKYYYKEFKFRGLYWDSYEDSDNYVIFSKLKNDFHMELSCIINKTEYLDVISVVNKIITWIELIENDAKEFLDTIKDFEIPKLKIIKDLIYENNSFMGDKGFSNRVVGAIEKNHPLVLKLGPNALVSSLLSYLILEYYNKRGNYPRIKINHINDGEVDFDILLLDQKLEEILDDAKIVEKFLQKMVESNCVVFKLN